VLRWIAERLDGTVQAQETAIGNLPNLADLGVDELDLDDASRLQLLAWSPNAVIKDLESIQNYLGTFGDRSPKELKAEAESRLGLISK
jgi:phosphoenolpyruvate carboxykinase (GTP)